MTKSQIISECSKGLSEDINGEFYTIFDANKLYDMIVNKAKEAFGKTCGWLSIYPWYQGVVKEFIKAMEE